MRERPIVMSGPEVRAVLAGTKTQFQRPIRPVGRDEGFSITELDAGPWPFRSDDGETAIDCPFGEIGDRLWVRETWEPDPPIDGTWASTQWHGCPQDARVSDIPERYRSVRYCLYKADQIHDLARWRPSIHMPRWASRITLEVTGVRVERLQDIREADSRDTFAGLWQSIYGPGSRASWPSNPWVWVIEFRRADAPGEVK